MTKKIVIDPGHGGNDPGSSANGIIEKDLNLKISKYIASRFKELGIEYALTRETDKELNEDTRPEIVQSFFGNGKDVIVLSNHINAGGGDGAEIIYALRNNDSLSKKIAEQMEISGQNVRKYYQKRLPSNPIKDYYYILRDTPNNESVIVEYGFLDSPGDDVNQLKNNWQDLAEAVVIAVADYIGVPYKAKDGDYYTVKSGDTLWTISKKYNITVDELKRMNNLLNNSLSVNQVLKVKESSEKPIEEEYYIVQKGDTLYSIANKNGISVAKLKELNNLGNNTISIGQKLLLKETSNTFDYYTVKSGDTLYSIAQKFNTTVSSLKELNNLSTNFLIIGQSLKIPVLKKTYIVQKGDTLYSIAQKNNTTVSELLNLNKLDTSNLTVGQKIIVL